LTCPAGFFSATPISCVECAVGSFSGSGGATTCSPCAPGSMTNTTAQSVCRACVLGTFASGLGSSTCAMCEAGTYGNSTKLTVCTVCSSGSYNTVALQSVCLTCAAGWFSTDPLSCVECSLGKFSAARSTSCLSCAAGSFGNQTGQSICQVCSPGFFSAQTESTKCKLCVPGSYTNVVGATACVSCDAGTWSASAGGTSCVATPPGFFTATTGLSEAVACSAGRFAVLAGQTQCASCANNFWNGAAGATTCEACPQNSNVNDQRTRCNCNADFYASWTADNKTACLACPTGAYCDPMPQNDRSVTKLSSKPGYWRVTDGVPLQVPVFMPCPLLLACPSSFNGSCNLGYRGPLCGVCSLGYHSNGQQCEACTGTTQAALFIVIAVAMVAIALFWYISQKLDTSKLVSGGKILVSYFQVMGSSSTSYQIPWPDFIASLLTQMRVALLDVYQVTAVDCWTYMDFLVPCTYVCACACACACASAVCVC
jgi:hypothetical protein